MSEGHSQDGEGESWHPKCAGEFNLEMTLLHRMIRIIIDQSYSPHQQSMQKQRLLSSILDLPLRLPLPPAYGWMQARARCERMQ